MKTALSEWLALTDQNKRNIFAETARYKALPISSIEKDWWVVHTLSALFSTEYVDKLVFKGGTSLSKVWHLIERFSEDVDVALDREFLVEIGSRSLKEPYSQRNINTFVSETFAGMPFIGSPVIVPTVNPERTFLEKVFLLHEEYQRPLEKMRIERFSRHLYDIEKISQTPYLQKALSDKELYNTIVNHRKRYSHLGGVDYTKHAPEFVRIVPPENLLPLWEKDYESMINSMVYGEKIPFNELINRIIVIQKIINNRHVI